MARMQGALLYPILVPISRASKVNQQINNNDVIGVSIYFGSQTSTITVYIAKEVVV